MRLTAVLAAAALAAVLLPAAAEAAPKLTLMRGGRHVVLGGHSLGGSQCA